jgi:predicted dienelactone hydrolase
MRIKALLLAALLGTASHHCLAAAAPAAPFHVGQITRIVHPAEPRNWRGAQTEALTTRIWFPVDASTPEQTHDIGPPGMPIFRAHPLSPGAPLSAHQHLYPLILMSHGTGGNADNMDWIAAPLAARGYIVAATDHPGNHALEPLTWDGFTLWWERATDITDVLDALLADPVLATHIDRDRIGALGFSLGGYTVLELAGARTNLPAFLAFCAGPKADNVCHPPEMDRVIDRPQSSVTPSAASRASLARSGDSYRDSRIKAVFAIAPALGQAFDKAGMRDVTIPVALMAGTNDRIAPPATNAAYIASLLPGATLTMVPGAAHYSFMPICAPAGVRMIPALCNEAPGVDREAIHAAAVDAAEVFFGNNFQQQRKERLGG